MWTLGQVRTVQFSKDLKFVEWDESGNLHIKINKHIVDETGTHGSDNRKPNKQTTCIMYILRYRKIILLPMKHKMK